MELSQRMSKIKSSETLAISAKAKAMRQQGIDVVNFSAGEPDFDTPEHIKEAAAQAMTEGKTKYTPVQGVPELRKAIVDRYQLDQGFSYNPNSEVMVYCGGKQILFNFFQAALNDGDEVIIPAPYWVSYPEQVSMAGGIPVILKTGTETKYKLTADLLKEHLTSRTKVVIINSPSNPTGTVYSRKELESLATLLVKHPRIWIVSDDVYDKLIYDGCFVNILSVAPELRNRVIIVNSMSKTYAMTGWRIGYGIGPNELIGAMTTVQSQSTSGPTSIAQYASAVALSGNQECVQGAVTKFKERRQVMINELKKIPGLSFVEPSGAFYVFVDVSRQYEKSGGVSNSSAFCEHLLNTSHVASVPGAAFGDDHCIRLSFALDVESIKKGMERIKKLVLSPTLQF